MVRVEVHATVAEGKPSEKGGSVGVLDGVLEPVRVGSGNQAVADEYLGRNEDESDSVEVHSFGDENKTEDYQGHGESVDVLANELEGVESGIGVVVGRRVGTDVERPRKSNGGQQSSTG